MLKILLIVDNIEAIKSQLRYLYPTVKSSHLSEAVARALGYNSNAALRAALFASKEPKISLRAFDSEAYFNWLSDKGYTLERTLSANIFSEVPVPLWKTLHAAKPAEKTNLQNQWFSTCKKFNIPHVYITTKTKYASVDWDYISVDEHHNPDKFTSEGSEKILSLFHKYKNAKSKYYFSVFVGSIEGLEEAQARKLASEIFDLLHSLIDEESQLVA